ncbi:hypothetical protein NO357_21400, partial [Marimonas arenosa]|nr:hypothetical protein [Marimonas arenosa]
MVYSLAGPDAFLFTVDATTGTVAPQDWFVPSLDDAWDQNEDHVYELTRVATPEDGSAPVEQALRFETTADGVLTELDPAPGGDAPTEPTDPVAPTDPTDPTDPTEPVDPGTPT